MPKKLVKKMESGESVIKKEIKKEEVSILCPWCSSPMQITGGGPSGTDYKCPKCFKGLTRR